MKLTAKSRSFKKTVRNTLVPVIVFVLIIMAGTAVNSHAVDLNQSKIYSDRLVVNIVPDSDEEIVSMDLLLQTNYGQYVKKQALSPSARTATITGLSSNNSYSVKVNYKYKFKGSTTGNVYDSSAYLWDYETKLTPVRVTSLKQDRWYYYIKQIDASWKRQNGVDGYQYEFYNWKNKRIKTEVLKGAYNDDVMGLKVKNGKSYKMRVRAYSEFQGRKVWGPWSTWTHFVGQTPKFTSKFKNKKLTVSWKKVTGATSYTIMVSTNPNKGYKAVKTVSSKKKAKVTVSKLNKKKFKKGKTYYVYVRSNKKVGKKTFNSNNNGLPLYYNQAKCK